MRVMCSLREEGERERRITSCFLRNHALARLVRKGHLFQASHFTYVSEMAGRGWAGRARTGETEELQYGALRLNASPGAGPARPVRPAGFSPREEKGAHQGLLSVV